MIISAKKTTGICQFWEDAGCNVDKKITFFLDVSIINTASYDVE